METIRFSSAVYKHCVYKRLWQPIFVKIFEEISYRLDPFIVSVIRDGEILGHVPVSAKDLCCSLCSLLTASLI